MKKQLYYIGITLALMSCHTTLKAQVEQTIVVSEYNGQNEKTPLPEVSVSVLNAGAAASDQNGQAVLRFRTLHAGDQVSIRRIEKAGYEIFNSMALEQWTISPQRPFQIILCRSDKFKALRDQYSRVASDSYAKQYKAEMNRLAQERKKTKMLEETYQQRLLDIENQYQQQLEDLENYVDQFARIDISELNSQQQELINLVKEGKIDKAIQKYESQDYQSQYKKQCEDIAKIDRAQAQLAIVEAKKRSEREKVFQSINRQIATYRLAGGRENFNKVNALMKSVADADTTQLEAVWAYAHHALNQRMISECEKYFNIYVRACEKDPALQANAWSMLGQGYMLQHEISKAEEALTKALAICEELYQKEPERFAYSMASIQMFVSVLYTYLENVEKAAPVLNKAIPICEKLYAEEPEAYQADLSYLYSNQGTILCLEGDYVSAKKAATKACELVRPLNKNTYETAVPIFTALNKLSEINYRAEKWEDLITCTIEYNEICETLYKQNPDEMRTYLQCGHSNLAEAYLHLKDYDNCEKSMKHSEELLNEMIEKEGQSHDYDKVNLYDIAVKLYHALGNTEKKNYYLEAARTAFQQLAPEEKEMLQELMNSLEALK